MIPDTLVQAIQAAARILCLSHVEPDGDAYGSTLGLKWILEGAGKQVTVGLDSPQDDTYAFLPGFETVRRPGDVHGAFDLIVIADSSSPDRMGAFRKLPSVQQAPWAVIDHHPTNLEFGAPGLNWVAPEHLSACNMIVHLCDALGYACPPRAKKCLMTGMITDSLCFRVYSTDQVFMQDVMRVMGPDSFTPYDIVSRTLGAIAYIELQLWAAVLPTLQLQEGIIWVTIREEQTRTTAGERIRTGGLVQKLLEAREAEVAVTFTEKTQPDGRHGVVCSFRCRPYLDVSALALSYDGGGHQMAAGCFIEAPLEQVVAEVVGQLKALVAGAMPPVAA